MGMMNSAYVEYHSLDLVHLCRECPCTGTERVQGEICGGCVSDELCSPHSHMDHFRDLPATRESAGAFPGSRHRLAEHNLHVIGTREAAGGKIKIQQLSSLSSHPKRSVHAKFCEIASISSNLQRLDVSYVHAAESAQNFQDELSVTGGTARATTSNGSEQHDSTRMTVLYGVKTFKGDANTRRGMTWDHGSRR